jgi:hypothetical protein
MATPLFRKLNLAAHDLIHVLDAPLSFEPELEALRGVQVRRALPDGADVGFVLCFAAMQSDLRRRIPDVAAAAAGDAVVWFAYPKGSSKRYRCDFDRDHGWEALRAAGFDSVRQVAIDADWSALRFRRVEFIGR